jgi:hypothetical protein
MAELRVSSAAGLVEIAIKRTEVEACDTSSVVRTLESFVPGQCDLYRNSIDFAVIGYDDDPRDVWDIPEVREFYRKLFHEYKGMFYWMNTRSSMFDMMALLLNPVIKRAGGSTVLSEHYQQYLATGFALLNDFCRANSLAVEPANVSILEMIQCAAGLRPTRWANAPSSYVLPPLPPEVWASSSAGFMPVMGTTDVAVGREVVLVAWGPTQIMQWVATERPIHLVVKYCVERNQCGTLAILMFCFYYRGDADRYLARCPLFMDPTSTPQMDTLRHLAGQSHWHFAFFGTGNRQYGPIEFANSFGLGATLDRVAKESVGAKMVDFGGARALLMRERNIDDLCASMTRLGATWYDASARR